MEMMLNLMMTGLNNMIGTESQMILNTRNTQNINICCGAAEPVPLPLYRFKCFNNNRFRLNSSYTHLRYRRVRGQVPEPSIFNVRNGTYSKKAFR